jgi:uncharacterized protein YcbK (DUF882 family)
MLTPAYAAAGDVVHVVGRGETLYWIARHYHVGVEALREANDLGPGSGHLRPGVQLVIPQKGKARASVASTATTPAARRGEGGPKGKAERAKKAAQDKPAAAEGVKTLAADEKPTWRHPGKGARRGFVRLVRGGETLEVQLVGRKGRLSPKALGGLRRILRFYPTGAETPIDPRLAALLGQVSDHFGGKPLHIVSGFRPYTPAQYTPHSNHNFGRAMDFNVEGVPNTVVRDFCRTFRDAGVGYYPNSTFVHLDVRAAKTYWVDYSRPGEAPHYDSPHSRGSADESATDVQPHAGAGDPDPGSAETR